MVTKRSNVFPATLLVGLSVNAVAFAFATAAAAVEVYWTWADAVARRAVMTIEERILDIKRDSRWRSLPGRDQMGKDEKRQCIYA
jgi:hypothetical protein